MVERRMLPGVSTDWAAFCRDTPPCSIALDGYVLDGPKQDLQGLHLNLNHHDGVYRPATRATCAQALIEVRAGLFELFQTAILWENDCDEDVATADFILHNTWFVRNAINPRLNRLVGVVDMMDTFGGAYLYPKDLPILQEHAWVFQPYRTFRADGGLDRKRPEEFISIIEDVGQRIHANILGNGKSLPLDLRYKILRQERGWVQVEELGAQCRTGMLADGIRAFWTRRGDHAVVIGKFSPYIPLDLEKVCAALNDLEGTTGGADRWGGGASIIGSPRLAGTHLSDTVISEVLSRFSG